MILQCPECSAKLSVLTFRNPIASVPDPTNHSVTYTLCWSAKVDLKCPVCGKTIDKSRIEDIMPQNIIVTEGARELSKLNGKRLTSARGSAAARKRWDEHNRREAIAAGVSLEEFVRLKKHRKHK